MKTWMVFVLVGFVALTIALVVRAQRRENERRTARHFMRDQSMPRNDSADSGFLATTAIFGAADSSPHVHGTDCASTHDAGGSCSSDGGGSTS